MDKWEKVILDMETHAWRSWEYGYPIALADETVDTIIEAVEKQKPMKPKRYIGEYEHENYPICPACGACISDDNFCFKCGQKLDWEVK